MQIRGKRGVSKSTKDQPIRQRPGRPPKSSLHLQQSSKSVVLSRLKAYHSAKRQRMEIDDDRLSSLERLPVELIQQIFFHALELNLLQASTHLHQVLSTEQIYDALIVFAYFDDDGESPVEKRHFLPAEYRRLDHLEKARLQRSIFQCRWGTFERIVLCMPKLSRLAMVQAWHKERARDDSYSRARGIQFDELTVVVPNDSLRELARLPDLHEETRLERHYFARSTLENLGSSAAPVARTTTAYLPRIVTWTSSIDVHGIVHKSTDRGVTTLASRHVPDRLLRGPDWTEHNIALLRLLRQGYTFIQDEHVMSISAHAVFDGMRNAIMNGAADVLKILLDYHNVLFKSGSWTMQSMLTVQLTPASQHPLPVDLFHLAAKQGGDQATELLSLLIRAGIDSLPRDDPEITAWAVRGSRNGNALARWLLKHMEGTADYGLPRRGHLFVDGCLSWRARARGHLPFPETSFASELGYIPGTPVVPTGADGGICGEDLPG